MNVMQDYMFLLFKKAENLVFKSSVTQHTLKKRDIRKPAYGVNQI
jgi:hypothetical protein